MAEKGITRRSAIQGMGAIGAAALAGGCATTGVGRKMRAVGVGRPARPRDWREQIVRRVAETPLVDSHEHLLEEDNRLKRVGDKSKLDDWSYIMDHYLDSDLLTAGMPRKDHERFFAPGADPMEKWRLVEPWWPAVRQTGYGQAVAIALRELYGVDDLNAQTVGRVQEQYAALIRPGFYKKVLVDTAGIDSCQVNSLQRPFTESRQPELLLQDISFIGMHMGPNLDTYAPTAGIEVRNLADWHKVIDWWFEKYGPYAVAVKSQAAYSRDVDFAAVPAADAAPVMKRVLEKDPVSAEERKKLEDHLFWYCVGKATAHGLPVKIHTGYYAGQNRMPLDVVAKNPGSASRVLRHAIEKSPETRFVLMHIGYPYYEDMIALAKQYTNCCLDMCWAWIINPAASVQFLKHYLVTAPANKVLTFGGDYIPVEPVVGHAALARNGIARALIDLVDEGWLTVDAALGLVEGVMCGNGRTIFRLEEKKRAVKTAPWIA